MKKLTLLMAMREEAEPLIDALEFKPVLRPWRDGKSPMQVFRAKHPRFDLSLVLAGVCERNQVDLIGTQPATLATHLAISDLGADLLINAGTAGGFISRGGTIGKVYLAYDRILFHDRRIALPGFDNYGVGSYPTPDTRELARKLGIETGVVSSGNSLDCPPQDFEFMSRQSVVAKEMEAAAIAWVASLHGVPLFVLKSITDLVDSGRPTAEEFLKHLNSARVAVTEKLIRLIDLLPDSTGSGPSHG